jgi:hypothetical protein
MAGVENANRASAASDVPPPGIRWTFHSTALVADYRAAVERLGWLIGLTPLECSNAGPPVSRLGGCCAFGDSVLELAESNDPASPLGRWMSQHGPSFLNLALQVADLGSTVAWLAERGVQTTVPAERGFTFARPSTTCGLQIEWADMTDLEWEPRFGAAIPQGPKPLIEAPRVAWWGALVAEPETSIPRLASLFGVEPVFLRLDAPDEAPLAALALPDGLFHLYRLPADLRTERALWGSAMGRPRTHAAGLRVRDLAATAEAFAREGVGVMRGTPAAGEIVTDPRDTAGLTFAWTDRDLEGDPRGPLV